MKIDAKKLKEKLTPAQVKQVLSNIGIPLAREEEDALIFYSGEKHRKPMDGKPKLYYYINSKIFIGYSSSFTGDIFSVIQARKTLCDESISFINAVRLVANIVGYESVDVVTEHTERYHGLEKLESYLRIKRGDVPLKVYEEQILNNLCPCVPKAWKDEGVTEDIMNLFQLRLYKTRNSIVIPVRNERGELVGIRQRHTSEEDIEQYGKYVPLTLSCGKSYKFPTNSFLFGEHIASKIAERQKKIFMTEGEKATMQIYSFLGMNYPAVAMFGKVLSRAKVKKLLKWGIEEVIYIADNDIDITNEELVEEQRTSFKKHISKIEEQLKPFGIKLTVIHDENLLPYKSNLCDLGKEKFIEYLDDVIKL